jgi:polygalacturonase
MASPPGSTFQYDVRRFGALGDGQTVDTQSLQAAIDACAAQGAGVVFLPRGT